MRRNIELLCSGYGKTTWDVSLRKRMDRMTYFINKALSSSLDADGMWDVTKLILVLMHDSFYLSVRIVSKMNEL